MAKFVFGMNQSLDGYVDHTAFGPGPKLFQHFIELVGNLAGSVYGRNIYEIMRYWDEDKPDWSDAEKAFAAAWRNMPKWVASHTLKSVGPNATLLGSDIEAELRNLKSSVSGVVAIAGPNLVNSLKDPNLIDEYDIYLHPVVLGAGAAFFAGPRPPLQLKACTQMDENVLRLTYVPAAP